MCFGIKSTIIYMCKPHTTYETTVLLIKLITIKYNKVQIN